MSSISSRIAAAPYMFVLVAGLSAQTGFVSGESRRAADRFASRIVPDADYRSPRRHRADPVAGISRRRFCFCRFCFRFLDGAQDHYHYHEGLLRDPERRDDGR